MSAQTIFDVALKASIMLTLFDFGLQTTRKALLNALITLPYIMSGGDG